MNPLNQRSGLLTPSATLAMAAQAAQRKREGLPVYNLSVGEPDFGTPAHIKQAAQEAIEAGFTFYTASGGIPELKVAIAEKLLRDQKTQYTPAEITCANGGKQILFNLFQVLLDPGDEVILTDPTWLSYQIQIEWAGGVCRSVPLNAKEGFRLKAAQLEALICPKTKAIVLNSPANPTGAIIEESELHAIAELARHHGFFIVSDDVYEFFYYTSNRPAHILSVAPDLKNQMVLVNSVSKTYAMTGWRLGYAAGPQELIAKMEELQSQSASNPCSISQKAALTALTGPQESVEDMRQAFIRRRQTMIEAFTHTDRLMLLPPDGAFYGMVDISKILQPGEDDGQFCQRLLREKGVAVVPGSAFGPSTAGWIRLSFAVKDEVLEEALRQLVVL